MQRERTHASGKIVCKKQECMQKVKCMQVAEMQGAESSARALARNALQEAGKLASDMHVVGIGGRNARMQWTGMAFEMREADMEIVGMKVSQAPKMKKEQNLKKGK
jgi:hypothetical protein